MSWFECVQAAHTIVGSKLSLCSCFFFVSIFILFIFAASACSSVCVCVCNTVVSIYSAYCLLLFYGLCCCAYGDNEKQNLLNICICYACVFVCVEKGKMLL